MRGIRSKLLLLLSAPLLLAGLAHADGTSLPIVDFSGSGTCVLGIDEPEPWPSGLKGFQLQSGSAHLVFGTHGEMYLLGQSMLSCNRSGKVAVLAWEAGSPQGGSVLVRYALDGAWSEPAVFTDPAILEPPASSLGTLRLLSGSLGKEANMMPSTRLRRPLVGPAPRTGHPALALDGPPSVAVSPVTGATIVVWSRRGAAGFDLVASEFANGAWSEPNVVAGSAENERDPQLVAGPDGAVALVYWVDGPAPGVLLRWSSGDLRSWSEAVRISGPEEVASRPAGAFHDGVLHVVWERSDLGLGRTPTSVVLARPGSSGWESEVLAVSWSREPLSPRSHDEQGRLWVDWDDGDGATGWVRMDAAGRWEAPRYELGDREEVRLRALQAP